MDKRNKNTVTKKLSVSDALDKFNIALHELDDGKTRERPVKAFTGFSIMMIFPSQRNHTTRSQHTSKHSSRRSRNKQFL